MDTDDKLTKSLCVRVKKQSIGDKCEAAVDWLTRKNRWVVLLWTERNSLVFTGLWPHRKHQLH